MKELSRLFRVYCRESHSSWANYLPNIEKLFNYLPHISTRYSPNEILGFKMTNDPCIKYLNSILPRRVEKPTEDLLEEVKRNLHLSNVKKSKAFKTRGDRLCIGDLVLLKENRVSDASKKQISKFFPLYSGPYKIVGNPFPNVYKLMNIDTKEIKGQFNINNLKVYHMIEGNVTE